MFKMSHEENSILSWNQIALQLEQTWLDYYILPTVLLYGISLNTLV